MLLFVRVCAQKQPDENKRKQNEIASIGGFYFDHTDEHFVARRMAMPSCTNFGCVFIAWEKTYKALVACTKLYSANFIPHHPSRLAFA